MGKIIHNKTTPPFPDGWYRPHIKTRVCIFGEDDLWHIRDRWLTSITTHYVGLCGQKQKDGCRPYTWNVGCPACWDLDETITTVAAVAAKLKGTSK